jgi:methyl-accepting chemotaxis protein
MAQWTLGKKIIVGGVGFAAITLLQGFLSLSSMYRTRKVVDSLNHDTFATLFMAGKMKAMAKDERIAIIFDIYSTSENDLNKYEAQVEKAEVDLRQMREQYPKFDPKDRDGVEALDQQQAKFYQDWIEIKALSRAGRKDEAWTVYNTKLQAATLARRKIEESLAEIDNKRGESITQEAIDNVARGIPEAWTVLFLSIAFSGTGVFWFSRLVDRSIAPLETAILILGKGVLGKSTKGNDGDSSDMSSYMNAALKQMIETISGIDHCGNKIEAAVGEICTRTTHAASVAVNQRDRIRQIGDSMVEMVESVQRVSENSSRASDSAGNAVEIARRGGAIVNDALVHMKSIAESVNATANRVQELGKSSDQIGQIVKVIDEIAGQTNLLALNAAIEAARAGQHGRGFAVVAGEVRRLAERTTTATKEIAATIETVQAETQRAVRQMQAGTEQVEAGVVTTSKAGASLVEIIAAAQNVGDMIASISTAASHQGDSAVQINTNVEQIAGLTTQAAEDSHISADSCQHLFQLSNTLRNITAQFQFR